MLSKQSMWRNKNKKCVYYVFLAIFIYIICFYLFWSTTATLWTTEKCPICYGFTACDKLYANQLKNIWPRTRFSQTIYYAKTPYGTEVVLKRLASSNELSNLDNNFCNMLNLSNKCEPNDALEESLLERNILKSVAPEKTLDSEHVKGLIMCPYAKSIFDLIRPFVQQTTFIEHNMLNIWTLLNVNPEPLILQLLPREIGWRVPTYGGVCGRLEIVTYEGEPITSKQDYRMKLHFAKEILEAALEFTYKHDRYRFYLMDWSLQNIVANEIGQITFVDLEDLVVVDKNELPDKKSFPDWVKTHGVSKKPNTTLYENLCRHHLSDHNIWAACNLLGGGDDPLLYPIPEHINKSNPSLDVYLQNCLQDSTNRFRTVLKLKHAIRHIWSTLSN